MRGGKQTKALSFIQSGNSQIIAAITLGKEYDKIQSQFLKEGEILKAYALDVLAQFILKKSYHLLKHILEEEQIFIQQLHFVGEHWPMECMPECLEVIKQQDISCNEAFVLKPRQSIVIVAPICTTRVNKSIQICADCSHKNCKNREVK